MNRLVSYCILVVFILVTALPASADQLTDKKSQKSTVDSKLNNLSKSKKEEEKKKKAIEAEQKNIINTQAQQKKEFDKVMGEIKQLSDEIKTIDDSIQDAEETYQKQQDLLKTRLRVMYENTDSTYMETLIQSKSISDFFERMELISMISKKDKEIVELAELAKKDVEYKKEEKENQKAEVQKKAGEKQQALENLKVSRADVEDELKKVKKRLDELEAQEDALVKQSNELESQIRNLQKKNTKYAGGSMLWPSTSSRSISSYFGNRLHPILKKYKTHTGIDINAGEGTNILAANKGTVILAGWQNGYGNTVIVDHGGGITTLYGHCSRLLVGVGKTVAAGDIIAKVGHTGLATGPHLHFEVRKGGVPVNPLDYVSP